MRQRIMFMAPKATMTNSVPTGSSTNRDKPVWLRHTILIADPSRSRTPRRGFACKAVATKLSDDPRRQQSSPHHRATELTHRSSVVSSRPRHQGRRRPQPEGLHLQYRCLRGPKLISNIINHGQNQTVMPKSTRSFDHRRPQRQRTMVLAHRGASVSELIPPWTRRAARKSPVFVLKHANLEGVAEPAELYPRPVVGAGQTVSSPWTCRADHQSRDLAPNVHRRHLQVGHRWSRLQNDEELPRDDVDVHEASRLSRNHRHPTRSLG